MEPLTHTRERLHDTSPIEIVLVDEQLIFNEGLRKLFEVEPDFNVVGSACDPDEAARLVEEHRPDVVIVSLKGRPLVRLVNRLSNHTGASASNDARLIVLTTAHEKSHIFRTPHSGIAGILFKQTSPQLLFESVRSVVAGHCWLGCEPMDARAAGLRRVDAADTHPFGLTAREYEIVASVCRGDTNKTIARQLTITQDTVKHHLTNIFNKLGVSNRLQLAVFAFNPSLSQGQKVGAHPLTADYRHH